MPGLGLVLDQDGVGLALGLAAHALRLGLGGDLDLALLDLLAHDLAGGQPLLLGERTGPSGSRPAPARRATSPRCSASACALGERRVRLGDVGLRRVLALDRLGLLLLHEDALVGLGLLLALLRLRDVLGDADRLLAVRLRLADRGRRLLLLHEDALVGLGRLLALLGLRRRSRRRGSSCSRSASASPIGADLLLLGHVDLGLVDRLGRRLLADALDVVGLVGDVGDVDVDQVQADLVQLRLDVLADRTPGSSRGPG